MDGKLMTVMVIGLQQLMKACLVHQLNNSEDSSAILHQINLYQNFRGLIHTSVNRGGFQQSNSSAVV
jgi:hypothetical protein